VTRSKMSNRNGDQIPNAFEVFHIARGLTDAINRFCLDHEIITWHQGPCRTDQNDKGLIPIIIEYKPSDKELKKIQGRTTVEPGDNE